MTSTVLITGGSRGIGYATAELFAKNGWQVALCSRNETQAKQAAEKIARSTSNSHVHGYETDIGDRASIDRLFAQVQKQFSSLDVLVNNAAVLHMASIFELGDTAFDETMRINVTGLAHCCRKAFEWMRKSGGANFRCFCPTLSSLPTPCCTAVPDEIGRAHV